MRGFLAEFELLHANSEFLISGVNLFGGQLVKTLLITRIKSKNFKEFFVFTALQAQCPELISELTSIIHWARQLNFTFSQYETVNQLSISFRLIKTEITSHLS